MTFSSDNQPASRRGRASTVTRQDVSAAWNRIRVAADKGSIPASALLIALAENRPFLSAREVMA